MTGHEVIGKVAEVGSKVTEFKVGQRVGVGAQVGSCGECKSCKNDNGALSFFSSTTSNADAVDQSNTAPLRYMGIIPFVCQTPC